jgi:uncharacterized membrane protein YphA (DoxX/SURF4 family)
MMESAPFNYRRMVIWLGRLVLGPIFIYAGYSKLFYPNHMLKPFALLKFSVMSNLANFGLQVESYKLLSPSGVDFVSHTLPFAEVTLGLLLLIGWRLRIWAAIVTFLMLAFLTMVTRAYVLHMDINCGCFATPEPVSLKKIGEDGLMALLAVLMTVFSFLEARKPHPWSAAESAAEVTRPA